MRLWFEDVPSFSIGSLSQASSAKESGNRSLPLTALERTYHQQLKVEKTMSGHGQRPPSKTPNGLGISKCKLLQGFY